MTKHLALTLRRGHWRARVRITFVTCVLVECFANTIWCWCGVVSGRRRARARVSNQKTKMELNLWTELIFNRGEIAHAATLSAAIWTTIRTKIIALILFFSYKVDCLFSSQLFFVFIFPLQSRVQTHTHTHTARLDDHRHVARYGWLCRPANLLEKIVVRRFCICKFFLMVSLDRWTQTTNNRTSAFMVIAINLCSQRRPLILFVFRTESLT